MELLPPPGRGRVGGEGDTIEKYIIRKLSLDHPPPNPLPSREGGGENEKFEVRKRGLHETRS